MKGEIPCADEFVGVAGEELRRGDLLIAHGPLLFRLRAHEAAGGAVPVGVAASAAGAAQEVVILAEEDAGGLCG